jgi:hypothetical protein
MTDTYESFVGPIHPGYYKAPTLENQKHWRELAELSEKETCFASLFISHPTITAAEITEWLELEPSSVLNAGETVFKSERYDVKQKGTSWRYELAATGKQKEKVLNDLLDDLHGKLPAIRRLQDNGARMFLTVEADLLNQVGTLIMSAQTLTRLAQLRTTLILQSIFQVEEDDDDDDDEFEEDDEDAGEVKD